MTLRVAKEGLPGPFRPPYTSRIHARGVARTLLGQSLEGEFSEVHIQDRKQPREEDSVSFWWVWAGTSSLVCLALAAQNMGRTGPIPTPTPPPGGDPGVALLVGALF